jgi:dinuclear metal center YbgI/SA1388 family protein
MTVREIHRFLDSWAPAWTSWERDNVGLQVGDPDQSVRHVLVTLDVTPEVVEEAAAKKAQLILSHHPLLFRPPKNLRRDEPLGAMVHTLAAKRISVISAHTNLDFATGGVSFALASRLGIINAQFLSPLKGLHSKIVVFVPESHVESVTSMMAQAGAGVIGDYSDCSFQVAGRGTFRGSEQSRPYLGKPLTRQQVPEIRLEMVLPRALTGKVVTAMKSAHPYDEVAYDVYDLHNPMPGAGEGVIGDLPRPVTLKAFLALVKNSLTSRMLRFTGDTNRQIRRVALCGGNGSSLLEAAIGAGADAFVTSDIRYQTFHESTGRIALIDAGHWETEHVILRPLADRLRGFARAQGDRLTVSLTRRNTNPVQVV